jgi:hypothetical protein
VQRVAFSAMCLDYRPQRARALPYLFDLVVHL